MVAKKWGKKKIWNGIIRTTIICEPRTFSANFNDKSSSTTSRFSGKIQTHDKCITPFRWSGLYSTSDSSASPLLFLIPCRQELIPRKLQGPSTVLLPSLIRPGCHCQTQVSLDCFPVSSLFNELKQLVMTVANCWVLLCVKSYAKRCPCYSSPLSY